jgi:hypothetical protein
MIEADEDDETPGVLFVFGDIASSEIKADDGPRHSEKGREYAGE